MREHGVARFPDPTAIGLAKVSAEQLGVTSDQRQTADSSCRQLLPNGGQPASQASQDQIRALSLQFARCIRDHGIASFPDPDGSGRIPDPSTAGIDQGAPAFQAANQACSQVRPPYFPANDAYNAYVSSHHS